MQVGALPTEASCRGDGLSRPRIGTHRVRVLRSAVVRIAATRFALSGASVL